MQRQVKVCICLFRENRLLRLHFTSAFFDDENKENKQKTQSIFKLAMDLKKAPKTMDKTMDKLMEGMRP